MTRRNIEISPIGMNGYIIVFDMFFWFSFVVYGACMIAANVRLPNSRDLFENTSIPPVHFLRE